MDYSLTITGPSFSHVQSQDRNSPIHRLTRLFWTLISMGIASAREVTYIFYICVLKVWYRQIRYIPFFYKPEPFTYYGLNPSSLSQDEEKSSVVKIAIFSHGLFHD